MCHSIISIWSKTYAYQGWISRILSEVPDNVFLVINIFFKDSHTDLPGEAIGPTSGVVSIPGFLRKPIATCDFTGQVGTPCSVQSREGHFLSDGSLLKSDWAIFKFNIRWMAQNGEILGSVLFLSKTNEIWPPLKFNRLNTTPQSCLLTPSGSARAYHIWQRCVQ